MWSEQPLFLTFKGWFNRNFSNQAAIALMITIIAVILIFIFFGAYLVPVFIGLVLAYLLLPVVRMLKKWHCPHSLAVIITYLLFVVAYVGIFFALVPFLIKQMTSLVEYMPELFRSSQAWLVALEKHFPEFFSSSSVDNISSQLSDQVAKLGQLALQFSLSTLPGLIQTLLYLILVPILVLFFIRDADQVGSWLQAYLPKERG